MTQHLHDEEHHINEGEEEGPAESDALQEQVAGTVNHDPTAQLPVSREDEAFEDLERGLDRRR